MTGANGDYPGQRAVPCLFMRGGSSRGGYFLADDLPADPCERAAVLLACYGSPDGRQIDGIGGADVLTSKAAIIAPSARSEAEVEYTFCQVGIDRPQVATGGTCGNMLAGVGPAAVLRGLVQAVEPVTEVRVFTTNTGQVVKARVPMTRGRPSVDGDCAIAGVPGTGACIELDFGNCAGSVTGRLLPTGRPQQTIEIGGRATRVSLVDAATPFVFVRAEDVGAEGCELPDEIVADGALLARLEAVRAWAAVACGLVDDTAQAVVASPNVPRLIMVAASRDYLTPAGQRVVRGDVDLCVRQMAMQKPHKALAVTGSVCTAVAARLEGSVVHEATEARAGPLRLGHPSGILRVEAEVEGTPQGNHTVRSVRIERTARLIMSGTLYAPHTKIRDLIERIRR